MRLVKIKGIRQYIVIEFNILNSNGGRIEGLTTAKTTKKKKSPELISKKGI